MQARAARPEAADTLGTTGLINSCSGWDEKREDELAVLLVDNVEG
jgi:hypothetical protein